MLIGELEENDREVHIEQGDEDREGVRDAKGQKRLLIISGIKTDCEASRPNTNRQTHPPPKLMELRVWVA